MIIIRGLLQLLIYLIIVDVILSYVPNVRGQAWAQWIRRVADTVERPVRDLLPRDIPFDPTPMIVIILIQILMYLL
jgi:YggT family protein